MLKKYLLVKDYNDEDYYKEPYIIVEDAEEGSWYDEHKIAESDNVFDFIKSNGEWAVENIKLNKLLKVNVIFTKSKDDIFGRLFSDFDNCLYAEDVDYIYHKEKQNWRLVWSKNNENN